MPTIVVRTHGGLGNQLFQLLYAELEAERTGARLTHIHDLRYRHGFTASALFEDVPAPSLLLGLASHARLPKLLLRAGLNRRECLHLPGLTLLDGYFQTHSQYRDFSDAAVTAKLQSLRKRLAIGQATRTRRLCHIRLGDFFGSEKAQVAHLVDRLADARDCDVISNRDDLFETAAGRAALAAVGAIHRPTSALPPEQLLAVMAGYREIAANESTLAFWAAVLGGASIAFQTASLAALYDWLRQLEGENHES